jgi:hypothetical protein
VKPPPWVDELVIASCDERHERDNYAFAGIRKEDVP